MITALLIAGSTWMAISTTFFLALGIAAGKPMPVGETFQVSDDIRPAAPRRAAPRLTPAMV